MSTRLDTIVLRVEVERTVNPLRTRASIVRDLSVHLLGLNSSDWPLHDAGPQREGEVRIARVRCGRFYRGDPEE